MVKGVKAFGAGFQCRGFQFKENEVFEVTDLPRACRRGFHFCENPLDTLDYYPLIDDAGIVTEFAEVEALGDVDTEENKISTNKIRIGAKLGLAGFVKASFDFLWEKCWTDPRAITNESGDSEGNHTQLASSGDGARLASSGNHAQLASSGNHTQLASSGNHARLASSGDGARLASSGDGARLASSGDGARLASSGDGSQLASSGDGARLASSGDGARLASSGNHTQLASSGNHARLALQGTQSVGAAIGRGNNLIRGKVGSWITLAEWARAGATYKPVCVKSALIDGETIKADTWYALRDGEFVEVQL
ncbi:hypothetical protein GXP70_18255 [Paenibacillus lycopersici]|uniref:DUF7666 domain-containing protein n=1 Tax=Paenibacillus lycopersici TaxID=2704462 RepID=A0A6C0G6T2_9BACL|nr:hypothetical protein [Paenibacillus lycopersici]QHT61725.1 hypothetical protein GXP70_18255 [Paenibacillus lycopersici]